MRQHAYCVYWLLRSDHAHATYGCTVHVHTYYNSSEADAEQVCWSHMPLWREWHALVPAVCWYVIKAEEEQV